MTTVMPARRRIRAAAASTAVACMTVISAVSMSPIAHAAGVCDISRDDERPTTCADITGVTYTVVDHEGKPVTEVLPGEFYNVQMHTWIDPRARVSYEFVEDEYSLPQDNEVRLDFIGTEGTYMKDIRIDGNGRYMAEHDRLKSYQGYVDPNNENNVVNDPGQIIVPREARDPVGAPAPYVLVRFIDGSSKRVPVPMNVVESGAARHEIEVVDRDGDKEGNDHDRTITGTINMMVGKQKIYTLENTPQRGEEEEVPARIFITDEYGQVLDGAGEDVDDERYGHTVEGGADNSIPGYEGVGWARLEHFEEDGQERHRLRLQPGEAQLDNGEMKTNILHITTQFHDGTWRTNRLEITVVPYELLDATQVLPSSTIEAWTVKDVPLQCSDGSPDGNACKPQGHGDVRYESNEQNPFWMSVNKYSGQVTYKPQSAVVEMRDYPVVIDVKTESGANMQIKSNVRVIPNAQTKNVEGMNNTGSGHMISNTSDQSSSEGRGEKGFFAKFWSALTSVFR